MKNMKKILVTVVAALLLMTVTVMGTLAYLTSTSEKVVNTFTVGKVKIELDEAKVDEYGNLQKAVTTTSEDGTTTTTYEKTTSLDEAARVLANTYKLMPGHTYAKDPTVTVKEGSEESYIRIQVTVTKIAELDRIFEPDGVALADIFKETSSKWKYQKETRDTEANSITYEFWYTDKVAALSSDVKLDALFKSIAIPGSVTNTQIDTITDMTITAVAHAIQTDGFTDAAAAWAAFEKQTSETN